MKDHLGSIRQTLSESGAVQSAMDYYAFGGTFSSYVVGSTVDKYKFTGKERDSETGLDYFGSRYYDARLGIWRSVDPMADKYPGMSPYVYCHNNPISLIDPDGMGDEEPLDGGMLPEVPVVAPSGDVIYVMPMPSYEDNLRMVRSVEFMAKEIQKLNTAVQVTILAAMNKIYNLWNENNEENMTLVNENGIQKVDVTHSFETRKSGKEKASDIPSWAKGEKPRPGEKGKEFAKRLCDQKYGKGNYDTGPGSEYNKLKKNGDRR